MATQHRLPATTSQRHSAPATEHRRQRRPARPAIDNGTHRRQLPDLPDAADDAAQEPEPARSARHQPVHPAARAVRPGRAAAEVERPARHAGVAAADRAEHRRRSTSSARPSTVDGSTARSPTARRPGASTCPSPRPRPSRSPSSTGQTVYTGTYSMNAGTQPFTWDGKDTSGTAMAGRQLHDLGHGDRTPAASRSRSRPRSRRTVNSVDLTPDPAGAVDRRPELHARQDQARRPQLELIAR